MSIGKNDNVVSDDEEDLEDPNLSIPSKISRELRGLTTSYNTEAQKILDNLEKRVTRSEARQDKVLRSDSNAKDIGMAEIARFLIDVAKVAVPEKVNEDYIEPKTFQEAWHHKDAIQREKWREAIRKEFRDMTKRGVWRKTKMSDVPNGRTLVKSKWVFKIKQDLRFRARLVACGYSQIPGVDYSENYSPAVYDITFCVLILAMMIFGYSAKIVDVAAFLY